MTHTITTLPAPQRLTARRIAIILGAMIILPIIMTITAAMGIGLMRAAAETPSHTQGPDANTMRILDNARRAEEPKGNTCWAEWNEIQDGFEVICSHN